MTQHNKTKRNENRTNSSTRKKSEYNITQTKHVKHTTQVRKQITTQYNT